MDQAISLESDYLTGQIYYLRKELDNAYTRNLIETEQLARLRLARAAERANKSI